MEKATGAEGGNPFESAGDSSEESSTSKSTTTTSPRSHSNSKSRFTNLFLTTRRGKDKREAAETAPTAAAEPQARPADPSPTSLQQQQQYRLIQHHGAVPVAPNVKYVSPRRATTAFDPVVSPRAAAEDDLSPRNRASTLTMGHARRQSLIGAARMSVDLTTTTATATATPTTRTTPQLLPTAFADMVMASSAAATEEMTPPLPVMMHATMDATMNMDEATRQARALEDLITATFEDPEAQEGRAAATVVDTVLTVMVPIPEQPPHYDYTTPESSSSSFSPSSSEQQRRAVVADPPDSAKEEVEDDEPPPPPPPPAAADDDDAENVAKADALIKQIDDMVKETEKLKPFPLPSPLPSSASSADTQPRRNHARFLSESASGTGRPLPESILRVRQSLSTGGGGGGGLLQRSNASRRLVTVAEPLMPAAATTTATPLVASRSSPSLLEPRHNPPPPPPASGVTLAPLKVVLPPQKLDQRLSNVLKSLVENGLQLQQTVKNNLTLMATALENVSLKGDQRNRATTRAVVELGNVMTTAFDRFGEDIKSVVRQNTAQTLEHARATRAMEETMQRLESHYKDLLTRQFTMIDQLTRHVDTLELQCDHLTTLVEAQATRNANIEQYLLDNEEDLNLPASWRQLLTITHGKSSSRHYRRHRPMERVVSSPPPLQQQHPVVPPSEPPRPAFVPAEPRFSYSVAYPTKPGSPGGKKR